MKLTTLDHPLAKHYLTVLRDRDTEPEEFRNAARRLCYSLVMALMRNNWRVLLLIALSFGLLSCASSSEPASPAQIAGMRATTIAIAPCSPPALEAE